MNLWNARRPTNQHDLIDLFRPQPSIFQSLLARTNGSINDWLDHLLEHFERNLALIFFPARQIDVELRRWLRGKCYFGFNHCLADARYGFAIAPDVESKIPANIVERDCNQQIIDVVSAQVCIAIGGNHFKNAIVELQNRNVERATAQVVDGNDAVLLL